MDLTLAESIQLDYSPFRFDLELVFLVLVGLKPAFPELVFPVRDWNGDE